MMAMDLLAQDFGTITFQDVVEFCSQQIAALTWTAESVNLNEAPSRGCY
jgi:hypothetical protein